MWILLIRVPSPLVFIDLIRHYKKSIYCIKLTILYLLVEKMLQRDLRNSTHELNNMFYKQVLIVLKFIMDYTKVT